MSEPLTPAEQEELARLQDALLGTRFAQLAFCLGLVASLVIVGLVVTFAIGILALPWFVLQVPAAVALTASTWFAFQARADPDALVPSLRAQAVWWWLVLVTGSLLALGLCGMFVSVFATF